MAAVPGRPRCTFELLAHIVEDVDHINKHASFTATQELEEAITEPEHSAEGDSPAQDEIKRLRRGQGHSHSDDRTVMTRWSPPPAR